VRCNPFGELYNIKQYNLAQKGFPLPSGLFNSKGRGKMGDGMHSAEISVICGNLTDQLKQKNLKPRKPINISAKRFLLRFGT